MGILRVISYLGEILSLKSTPSGILLAGYNTIERVEITLANAAVGTNILYSTAVPAGQVWALEQADCRNVNNGSVNSYIFIAPTNVILYQVLNTIANQNVFWTGLLHVKATERVGFIWYGCVLNDDLYAHFSYRKILVPT